MQRFTGIGNLVSDPRIQEFSPREGETEPRVKCSFKVAFDRNGKDAGADFLWVGVWNGSARACQEHLHKGSLVGVDGRISTNYDKEKDKEYVEVVAAPGFGVKFLTPKGNGGSNLPPEADVGTTPSESATPPASDDDIPF